METDEWFCYVNAIVFKVAIDEILISEKAIYLAYKLVLD